MRGAVLPLRDRLSIGRAGTCDLQLVHEAVSRHHAHLAADGEGRYILVDLVSGNGTHVDGHRIERQALRPNATIRIVDTELAFEAVDALAPSPRVLVGLERHPVLLTDPDGTEHGGYLIDDIIEFRTLRAQSLRGSLHDPASRRRFESLTQRLQHPPGPHAHAERRAFARFECSFDAQLRLPSGDELSCEVRDLGVDGAQLLVGEHDLEFDEIVWLSIELEIEARSRQEVLAGRVAWIDGDTLGLTFAGAPRSETNPAGPPGRELVNDQARTVRLPSLRVAGQGPG